MRRQDLQPSPSSICQFPKSHVLLPRTDLPFLHQCSAPTPKLTETQAALNQKGYHLDTTKTQQGYIRLQSTGMAVFASAVIPLQSKLHTHIFTLSK